MSYLSVPRLHFAGTFVADVSTVNNFPQHFEDPNDPPEPGWNPGGTGGWTLGPCTVRSAVRGDGTVARTAGDDSAVGLSLTQTGNARLVDLDSEQQMVSQIWGMQLKLGAASGTAAVSGAFKTTPFSDIWFNRARVPGGGDFKATAFYQSVLASVVWGDLQGSDILAELQKASASGLLSVKFNVDGFDQSVHVGRIVGTIGPALAGEPERFVVGRQCMGDRRGPVWYFPAVVDEGRGKLIADFGNALQTTSVRGPFDSTLDLQIGTFSGGQFSSLGRIPIGPTGWYEETAGVCEFPSSRALTAAELAQLAATPIGVLQQAAAGATLVAAEGEDGVHVRADDFVYRLSANEPATVSLRVSRFGKPAPNAQVDIAFDSSQLQPDGTLPVGVPPGGVTFPKSVTADAQGVAPLPLTAHSIVTPRDFIDGQVYGIRGTVAGGDPNTSYFNPADFISVLVWTDFHAPGAPTWWQDVWPILKQYAQLYPVMAGIVKLDDYDSVVANAAAIKMVFSVPETNPIYMPVTRDLSPAKRRMIVDWFATTGNAGKPNLGTPPADMGPVVMVAAAAGAELSEVAKLGGKTAAARRAGAQRLPFANRAL